MMYQPTCNSQFAGGGLMCIGLKQAGIRVVKSSDIDPKATAVMKANKHWFSDNEVYTEDVCLQMVQDQPETDIMGFTFPCTRYSAIADIHGTRTGDDLFLHAFRMWAIKRPSFVVVENVVGMKKFKVVMEAMTKLPGYYYHVECPLEATNWLPQRRDRLIIIATKKPFTPTDPKKVRVKTMADIFDPGAVVDTPPSAVARLKGKYRDMPIIVDPCNPEAIAPTCVAHYAKDKGTRMIKDPKAPHGVRPFSIREYARLQGVPDDYQFPDEVNSYRIIGNGVPVDMARWIGEQAMKYFN